MSTSQLACHEPSAPLVAARLRQLWVGLAPMVLLYGLYTVVRYLVRDRGPSDGISNANEILLLEERIGLDWEGAIQTFTLPYEWLVVAANWYYVLGFLPVILFSAGLSAMTDYDRFLWWRRRFVLTLLLALVGFALYPLAPPRMLPGMVDTLMVYGPRYYGDPHGASLFNLYGRIPSLVNVYAAMPSMHVAWSIMAGALLISALGRTWWSWVIGTVHPILMGVAVVVTANHYLLDIVLGVAALIGAFAILAVANRIRIRWAYEQTVLSRAGIG